MTRLALAGKWAIPISDADGTPSSCCGRSDASAAEPSPMAFFLKNWRLLTAVWWRSAVFRMSEKFMVLFVEGFVHVEDLVCDDGPAG